MLEEIQSIFNIFAELRYLALFLVALVEGPVISVVAGFLYSTGRLEIIPSLIILFFGDFFSDLFFYSVGNGSKKIILRLKSFKTTPARLSQIDDQFRNKPWKTMIIGKAAYGLGMTFMTAAGASRMTLYDFIKYISILNAIRSVVLFAAGFYFGKTIFALGPRYYPLYIAILLGFVAMWLYLTLRIKKTTENNKALEEPKLPPVEK